MEKVIEVTLENAIQCRTIDDIYSLEIGGNYNLIHRPHRNHLLIEFANLLYQINKIDANF